MPRKQKSASDQPQDGETAGTPPQPSALPPSAVRKVAKAAKSSRPKAVKKSRVRAAQPSSPKSDEEPLAPSRREPTDDEIRLRAYFIAERRMQMSAPGSDAEDWIEARRQLESELGGTAS